MGFAAPKRKQLTGIRCRQGAGWSSRTHSAWSFSSGSTKAGRSAWGIAEKGAKTRHPAKARTGRHPPREPAEGVHVEGAVPCARGIRKADPRVHEKEDEHENAEAQGGGKESKNIRKHLSRLLIPVDRQGSSRDFRFRDTRRQTMAERRTVSTRAAEIPRPSPAPA
jgi:hypothetical protein